MDCLGLITIVLLFSVGYYICGKESWRTHLQDYSILKNTNWQGYKLHQGSENQGKLAKGPEYVSKL